MEGQAPKRCQGKKKDKQQVSLALVTCANAPTAGALIWASLSCCFLSFCQLAPTHRCTSCTYCSHSCSPLWCIGRACDLINNDFRSGGRSQRIGWIISRWNSPSFLFLLVRLYSTLSFPLFHFPFPSTFPIHTLYSSHHGQCLYSQICCQEHYPVTVCQHHTRVPYLVPSLASIAATWKWGKRGLSSKTTLNDLTPFLSTKLTKTCLDSFYISRKNFSKGYSDIQVKVRTATSNDPWGPSGAQMNELARASFGQ